MRVPPALLVLAILSGCLGHAAPAARQDFGFTGTLLALATADQARELVDAVRSEGGEMALDGKIPVHFAASGLTNDACTAIQQYLGSKSYIESWTACAPAKAELVVAIPGPALVPPANDSSVIASAPVGSA